MHSHLLISILSCSIKPSFSRFFVFLIPSALEAAVSTHHLGDKDSYTNCTLAVEVSHLEDRALNRVLLSPRRE
jgi:hypothetical protein